MPYLISLSEARGDQFRRRCARAGRSTDGRSERVGNVADGENISDARLLLARDYDVATLIHVDLTAKQLGIRLDPDAYEDAADGHLKGLDRTAALDLDGLDLLLANDAPDDRFRKDRHAMV